MDLVLATQNQGKVVEMQTMLSGLPVRLSSIIDYHYPRIPDIVEDGETFLENARKKAHTVAEATGRPALADDSGLIVEALGGEPGVHSARYAGRQGNYQANNEKLLQEMADVPDDKRKAAFVCVMVLAEPDGKEWVVEGRCEGQILREYRGKGGFGFDPLFFVPGENATMAELSTMRKNEISHRGKALAKMMKIIAEIASKKGR